jgi:type I restriction enzyme S subunit
VKRLRHMVKIGPSPKEIRGVSADDHVTFVPMESIADGVGGLDTSTLRQLKEVRSGSYNYFADGDLLLAKVTPCFENGKKAVASSLMNGVGFATSEVHVIRPDTSKISRRYLHYLLCSEDFRAEGMRSMSGAGGLKRVSDLSILDYRPAISDLETQEVVASTLDHETARIDALIEKKTRFIKLLKEKRQALITQAVTKGLDPGVPMKDSGVEWIGEVPAHWEVLPIKRLVSIPITDGPHETPMKQNEGIPFVSAEAVRTGYIDFDKIWGYISEADHAKYSKKYKPKVGDIYMVKSGATTGVTAMVEDPREFNIWSPLAAMRPNNLVEPNYLLAALRSTSFLDGVAINWSYGTQQNIGMKTLSDLPVAVPSRKEQRKICAAIACEGERVAKLLHATERSIELLKERRSALITAAVTGQIDLRENAA